MDIRGKKLLVIGGAGLIGSHVVDELVKEDVAEIRVYDNFVRGTHENLADAMRDPRVKIFEAGGDITQIDLPTESLSGLVEIQSIVQDIPGIQFVYFDERDVVRHRLVQEIIKAYERYEQRGGGSKRKT